MHPLQLFVSSTVQGMHIQSGIPLVPDLRSCARTKPWDIELANSAVQRQNGRAKMTERPILFNGEMVRAVLDGRKTVTRRVVKPQPDRVVTDWTLDAEPGENVIWRGWPHRLEESSGINKQAMGELYPRRKHSPYGVPGDRLWVRETWRVQGWHDDQGPLIQYADGKQMEVWADPWDEEYEGWYERMVTQSCADCDRAGHEAVDGVYVFGDGEHVPTRWRPSIHMPRRASRIMLEVVSVRVERVQEIDEEGIIAEGLDLENGIGEEWFAEGEHLAIAGAPFSGERFAFMRLWDSINAKRGYGWDVNPWVWVVEFKQYKGTSSGGVAR